MINLTSVPYDIITNVIEPFTRNIQNINLQQDIVSFKTINEIYNKYCKTLYNKISSAHENINDFEKSNLQKLAWYFLEIDLHCFIIDSKILDEVFEIMNYATFFRLNNIADLNIILNTSEYKKTKTIVYKLWGFLTVNQRKQFCNL